MVAQDDAFDEGADEAFAFVVGLAGGFKDGGKAVEGAAFAVVEGEAVDGDGEGLLGEPVVFEGAGVGFP